MCAARDVLKVGFGANIREKVCPEMAGQIGLKLIGLEEVNEAQPPSPSLPLSLSLSLQSITNYSSYFSLPNHQDPFGRVGVSK